MRDQLADRWPATLQGADRSRYYAGARAASRAWVDGLTTRSGTPRWHRISRCGDPVAVWSAAGGIAWQHRWCRDRACVACCHSRSRQQSSALRREVERREGAPLYFVTLTRPRRRHESADAAWTAWMRAWTAVRHRPEWRAVAGAVRVLEATHSRRGWHVHGHCIIELREQGPMAKCRACNGAGARWSGAQHRRVQCRTCTSRGASSGGVLPAALDALLAAWEQIVGGVPQAQCAVPLELQNAGQLCKYVSKLFELRPSEARELFAAIASRRVIDGCGTWRGFRARLDSAVEQTPLHWYSSEVPIRTLEALPPESLVPFVARLPGVHLVGERRHGGRVTRRDTWRPYDVVHTATVADVLAALRNDTRPVWQRDTVAGELDAAVRSRLRDAARRDYRGETHHVREHDPLRLPDLPPVVYH